MDDQSPIDSATWIEFAVAIVITTTAVTLIVYKYWM